MRRFVPQGIRLRLVLAISAVSAVAVGASFIALHAGTGSDLRASIDDDLRTEYADFQQHVIDKGDANTPAQLEAASRRFVTGQRYHPESRIFAIGVKGMPEVTNQRAIVEKELEGRSGEQGESGEGGEGNHLGLLDAPDGLSTVSNHEAGQLRVLSEPIGSGANRIGTFRASVPLTSVTEAQRGLRNTFVVVGLGALALAIAIAIWLANLISRPLRRMASVATQIDAGDLSHRIEYEGKDEVGVLADAFNHMLDRLESGFRRQRQFVSDASHELRSPLTVLRGRIELLARDDDPKALAGEADELLREISRMDRLVSDMLTLAQAERGQLLQRRPLSVEDFVEDLCRDLPLLGDRTYRVDSDLAGTLDADPDRLAQVVRNLVSNAVRHTSPDGHIGVSVSASNGSAVFAVSDDGDGIPPERLERIFDRFYRTDAGRGREEGGSGLGLAIARAIVEAHGGTIAAESFPGRGATIRFEIPGLASGPVSGTPRGRPARPSRGRST
jgi:two-component system OmpR family sensor kinase